MTRLGKIARLPRKVREELNVRLQNGEVGRLLVDQRILELARALGQLRRQSHQAERLRIERDRWAEKKSEICQREAKEASEAAHNEVIWQMTKAQFPSLYGKPAPKAEGKRPRKRRGSGKAKGGRGGAPKGRGKAQDERAEIQDVAESNESNRIKANPTESDQIKPNQTFFEEVAQPGIDLPAAAEGGGWEDGPTQSNQRDVAGGLCSSGEKAGKPAGAGAHPKR